MLHPPHDTATTLTTCTHHTRRRHHRSVFHQNLVIHVTPKTKESGVRMFYDGVDARGKIGQGASGAVKIVTRKGSEEKFALKIATIPRTGRRTSHECGGI